ncbi:MAG: OmpH family outer membrane protein [Prevotella sp.]|nr:OmpH family outer membrane protein [Prevotella sp.]
MDNYQNKLANRRWMMVIALSFILCHLSFSPAKAQILCIGYLSHDSILTAMPQYKFVEVEMDSLRQAYEKEMQRVEKDFNEKYEAFLEGRKDYPRTIMLKRQTELQQLLERNVKFKEQSRRELADIRKQKLAPLTKLLNDAIANVAQQQHLLVVLNTDSNACPFIDPEMSVDITHEVLRVLTGEE